MLQISENAAKLIHKMTDRNGLPEGGLRIPPLTEGPQPAYWHFRFTFLTLMER